MLVLVCGFSIRCQAQRATSESDWPPLDAYASKSPVMIEVINAHVTVGRHYHSVFLRVYSDRTAECHYRRWGIEGEKEKVRIKKLAPAEFENLRDVLGAPELLRVNQRYGLLGWVVDSWMTWEIDIPRPDAVQRIAVDNFGRGAGQGLEKAYPTALVRLGCTIQKLRREVYGVDSGMDTSDVMRACRSFTARR
jgi:hypothetical protein